jgi:hypothetical protein
MALEAMKKKYPDGALVVRLSDGVALSRKSASVMEEDHGETPRIEEQAEEVQPPTDDADDEPERDLLSWDELGGDLDDVHGDGDE